MLRRSVQFTLPFIPCLVGLGFAVGRFRAHDPVPGLAFAIGGLLAMVLVIFMLPGSTVRG